MEKKPDRSEIITMTLLFALTLVLTVLKVTRVLSLPWLWVLGPLWLGTYRYRDYGCLRWENLKPCNHRASVIAAHSYGASKKRFAKTRSLHRYDADLKGFGISQQAFCNAKWSLYIRRHCLLRL